MVINARLTIFIGFVETQGLRNAIMWAEPCLKMAIKLECLVKIKVLNANFEGSFD